MPLVKKTLRDGILGFMTDSPPSGLADAATKWSRLYHSYASSAVAGAAVPTLNPELIKMQLLGTTVDFIPRFAAGIEAYWATSVWAGPGLTGTIPVSVGLAAVLISSIPTLRATTSSEQAADIISSVIDAYTHSLIIVLINPTGVITPTIIT